MNLSPSALRAHARSTTGQRLVKYTMVSVISVIVGQALLALALTVFDWRAAPSNVFAVAVSSVPAYYLNRAWAWGKRGRSHLMKEVLPFWGLNFLGLIVSTIFVDVAEQRARELSEATETLVIMGAALAGFALLWVAKFVILNKVLFRTHPQDLEDAPALDGRTGIPT